ncbi:MAG: SpoIIE family protein phosphatase [Candidatus Margulisiibacteriota bacterium]
MPAQKTLQAISSSLQDKVWSKEEIIEKCHQGLVGQFGFSGVNVYLLNPSSGEIESTYPSHPWPMPRSEKDWLMRRTKDLLIQTQGESAQYIYIANRKQFLYTDKQQLAADQAYYATPCQDGLYIVLISEEEIILGFIFINDWGGKGNLDGRPRFEREIQEILDFVSNIVVALDNLLIHQKIESLMSDKRELKQRIQKDEEDLKQRILELTVLYDTSNALGYTFHHQDVVSLVTEALNKVLHFDLCSIFLLDFQPGGEIISRVNRPVKASFIKTMQSNMISAIAPFIKTGIDAKKVRVRTDALYGRGIKQPEVQEMKSFANVPLIFKEEVIGILNVCCVMAGAFGRNEMTFVHTMANQLASHLGRLKLVKRIEKSKIDSLVKSMTEGVIMFDDNRHLEIMNPSAMELLQVDAEDLTAESLFDILTVMGLGKVVRQAFRKKQPVLNKECLYKNKMISVNVNPVLDAEQNHIGMMLVLRDITELHNTNRIKVQRLEVISRVHLILKTMTDLNTLLPVLMEFILQVAGAEVGSIQLKTGKTHLTKVHSNFPDKIRREYMFKSGETISEHVARTNEPCYLENFLHNPLVDSHVRVLIDAYLCIPIVVKDTVIGIINIIHKQGQQRKLNQDDIETLTTITSLSGTAIHNAILYQETLKKQRLDQELQVANDIQNKLLPSELPKVPNVQFGAISVPAREIGGDYYDFFPLESGKIGIVMADIVGKGVPAGLFMAMLKSILYTHVLRIDSPKLALMQLNKLLYKDPVINKFVPLFYAVLDPKTLKLTYCNAGHEPAMILLDGRIQELDTHGFPLGAFEDPDYEEKELQLKHQDMVVLFTDGLVEARDHKGNDFGRERLGALVSKHRAYSASKLVDTLYQHAKRFFKTTTQHDDLTLVVLKVNKRSGSSGVVLKSHEFRVSSSKKNIKRVRQEVAAVTQEAGFSDTDAYNIQLAVNEAQANVIEHAYNGSEHGDIVFKFLLYADRLDIVIKDFGPGINQKSIKGEEHLEELEGSGLGVFLIKTMMDKVHYRRSSKIGTELVLTKFLTQKVKKTSEKH